MVQLGKEQVWHQILTQMLIVLEIQTHFILRLGLDICMIKPKARSLFAYI